MKLSRHEKLVRQIPPCLFLLGLPLLIAGMHLGQVETLVIPGFAVLLPALLDGLR